MKISRKLAIIILRYLFDNPDFYFPFLVVCKEYTPEDNDFVEISPNEWSNIDEDESYQTFELWKKIQDIPDNKVIEDIVFKWFINVILYDLIEKYIKNSFKNYDDLYNLNLTESDEILKYWENEFFWWKREALQEVLELIENNRF